MSEEEPTGFPQDEGTAEEVRQVVLGCENTAVPLWVGLPFVGILLSVAFGPILFPHFWEKHVSVFFSFFFFSFVVPSSISCSD